MKTIPLTNSTLVALIDDEDYDRIISHGNTWHLTDSGASIRSRILDKIMEKRGHYVTFTSPKISMHRLVLNVEQSSKHLDVDHINGNNIDNQKYNLRLCKHHQNLHNVDKTKQGITSKYKGVSWHKKAGKWQVLLCVNGVRYYAGLFVDEIEAAKASNNLMLKYIGEFAKLNIL